jgi:Cu+-exporting ATPase
MSEQQDPEHDIPRRFWIALALTVPLALAEVARAAGPAHLRIGWLDLRWLELLLATPVVLWCGWPLWQRGWRSIVGRELDVFTPVALGVALAFGCSALVTLAPQLVPAVPEHGARPPLYFDSAAMIVTLVLLGQLLELRAWRHAAAALQSPLDLASTSAVAKALGSRAPVQDFADRASAWLVHAVIVVAVAAAVGWWALGPEPRLAHALVVAVSTLVIASPCALVLAVPMSMTIAMGRGVQAGIFFRSAWALERLEDVDTVVFDRTGTLTAGRPAVVSLIPVDGVVDSELLRLAASLEQASDHPVARAVVALAQSRGLRLGRNSGFRAVPGKGALGVVQMCSVAVGSAALMAEAGVDVHSLEPEAQRLRALGQTVIYVGLDGVAIGLLGVADPLRPEAWEIVQQIKAEGIRVVALSGDHEESVRAVAAQLGIEDVAADVRPEETGDRIAELRAAGNVVAMVGDGTNDASGLAAADIGITLEGATGIAAPGNGVTLPGDDLHGLVRALRLSEATMRNVGQGLVIVLGYNALGVPLAAGVLFHLTGWSLTPASAAAAMLLSWAAVIANALRLRSARL